MNNKRINRISEEVKKAISYIISNDLKDPRISPMTSVTHVEVTRDLRYAKVYISVLGKEKEKKDTIKGLESAKGFIRKEIGNKIDLRYVPEPVFQLDESIEHGIYMSKLIDKVNEKDKRGNTDE
ncbi:30S ribosome-binding factor RbfA [Anaerosalibacter bizertensis]|uniref:Ribosome-binding factor A n=1 Tax=Anaerosalibacter bizertensis TaxID=932217 RepID=A0A844FG52_9FIRM|nr:30S ribosome-binding factor RbfA [Anaerosalibacter bizertensis]MBV1818566.1 30S ribosome-binding factor RbfA [Bacteroidales bacterium MSK.15.36]HHV27276.1 30S ribosome-binding factor RbfA [Tissierellia bacterium]MBU5293254.1 30S ribosome-binding factor RbfA [Anaerosalibacter bizertensis]MCB5558778.1 30S ribosome-binding factor RbfA [Anaerosalibacter bizertensis]MCG4564610.1 30S ribosome-binding factor RbfA [Anaerosalibacter bizertensis]